ncbi:MAG: protein kinase [Deltaproteobacteria bacterium]|nr:protein kinase [Deltaproteobacteria bacterium]
MLPSGFPKPFGKYILARPLAKGGMGDLFLSLAGEVGGFEKLCVVKRTRDSATDDELVGRFLDEAKVAIKLNHSNLVQVFDVGTVDGDHYLAMEYVEGKNLREILVRCDEARLRLPPAAGLYVAQQICRGLHYAHSYGNLGLVHRDMCPSNVLVSYFGEVKVADFGLAYSSLKEEKTKPGKVFGRLAYLSPEQLRRATPDARTDVYSVGIILWELVTGRPFRPRISDPAHLITMVERSDVMPPSDKNDKLPPSLDRLIVKALQPSPSARYASAAAFREAIAIELARIDPTFDASNLAEIMRTLYDAQIEEAKRESEDLLKADYQSVRQRERAPSGSIDGKRPIADDTQISDRYRVINLIGGGGMGAVYEAEHLGIGRRVAIKVLHAAYSEDAEAVTRFREEARAASRIGHPNIVEVTDSGTTNDGRVFFVMELLVGTDLANVMADRGRLPIGRALAITLQICEALHAAHEARIVHRDLKPENIFLCTRPQADFVKLLDFGIAKHLSKAGDARLTMPGIAMGTPEYMAPEQAAGLEIDRRIDVYATATLLYEMLTARLPHEANNLIELLNKKASVPPTPPREHVPEIPQAVERAILDALQGDPDRRTPTMHHFADALRRAADNSALAAPLPAQHDAPRPPAARPTRSRLLTALAIAAPLFILGASAAYWWKQGTITPPQALDLGRHADAGIKLRVLDASGKKSATPIDSRAADAQALPRDATATRDGRAADAHRTDATLADSGPQLSAAERDRLLEWAKRAAIGGRFLRPEKDNVKHLLDQLEQAAPNDPAVRRFRKRWLPRQFVRQIRAALRAKRDAAAQARYEAWSALFPDAAAPKRGLAQLLVRRGQQALKKKRYRAAQRLAAQAETLFPEGRSHHVLRGDIALKRHRYAAAIAAYRRALSTKKVPASARRVLLRRIKTARKGQRSGKR